MDYQFTTNTIYTEEELDTLLSRIPRVKDYENWSSAQSVLINDNSVMFEPDIMEGRWLLSKDETFIVVSHGFFSSEPSYKVGDSISMKIGGEIRNLIIAGSMKNFGETTIFISETGFNQCVP
jgi:hypothetical protein